MKFAMSRRRVWKTGRVLWIVLRVLATEEHVEIKSDTVVDKCSINVRLCRTFQ